MPDLGDMADQHRDKIEQGAEKAVDAGEQRTGHRAPSQVDDRVDQIDPDDGDGDGSPDRGMGDERDRDREPGDPGPS